MRNATKDATHAQIAHVKLAAVIIWITLFSFGAHATPAQTPAPIWTYTGSLNCARSGSATLLLNGKVLVVGGCNDSAGRDSAELYDPATGTWSYTGILNTNRLGHTATLLQNGKVLVAGGYTVVNNNFSFLNTAELYDPATGAWSYTGSLNKNRSAHSATLLQNGKVLAAGGINGDDYVTNSAELYDPATGAWSVTGTLVAGEVGIGRAGHTATLLQNGKVLVAGGQDDADFSVFDTELYDPTTGTWSVSGRLNENRSIHTATLLPNGNVLIAGACNAGIFCRSGASSAELYNPATGTWSITGAMNTPRFFHTATLLPDGRVLIAGGQQINFAAGTSVSLNSAEIYDPASGNWSTTADLNGTRFFHAATLLQNGKVLVVGGRDGTNNDPLLSAELYDSGSSSTTNPIDDPQFFIRQQYLDFLGREPDSIGFQNWLDTLTKCANGGYGEFDNPDCDRVHVSAGFFQSNEFQGRGYWILRFGFVGLNRAVGSTRSSATYAEFIPALQQIGGSNSPAQEETAKVAYANAFVQRTDFQALFPPTLSNSQYVNGLESNAGVTLTNKQALIDGLNNQSMTRADVLRNVVESQVVFDKFIIPSFVTMEYFGYLRRDVDEIGYRNWVDTLTADPSNYRHMIFGFIYSTEYRQRFGP
jgi:N-acetylneuraminic acid mutarotase